MYPEKPKREEKPKRRSIQKQALARFSLALLVLVPSLFCVLARFSQKQFVDMALLVMMITLAVYLVYQVLIIFLASALNMRIETAENIDSGDESGNH